MKTHPMTVPVLDVMTRAPITVAPQTTVGDLCAACPSCGGGPTGASWWAS